MKKSLFTLAALATIMASCSSDDLLVDEQVQNNETQTAIGFQTFTQKATRAENSTETDQLGLESHHTTFSVWGYKGAQDSYVFGTSTTLGQEVLYDETEGWYYTPARFWDKNAATYDFYAAAPETTKAPLWTLNENSDSQSDDYFTLGPVTLNDETLPKGDKYVESMSMDGATNIDYMIASQKTVKSSDYSSSPVQLDFNHILSRLNITVTKGNTLSNFPSAEDAKLTLVTCEVRHMQNVGSFNESLKSGEDLQKGTNVRWTTTSGDKTYTAHHDFEMANSTTYYVLQSLVIPQLADFETVTRDGKTAPTTKPYLYVEYTIGSNKYKDITSTLEAHADVSTYYVKDGDDYKLATGKKQNDVTYYALVSTPEQFKAYYNLAAVFGVKSGESLAFNEGWQNTLNITIDADAITFTPMVYNWEDVSKSVNTKD